MITEALRQLNTFTFVKILKLHYSHFSCLPVLSTGLEPRCRLEAFTLNCNICNVLENCQACPCFAVISFCSHWGGTGMGLILQQALLMLVPLEPAVCAWRVLSTGWEELMGCKVLMPSPSSEGSAG